MHPVDFAFLNRFPDGLDDVEFVGLGKKHKPDNVIKAVNTELSKENLQKLINKKDSKTICEISLKLLRRASVLSVFEKVAFSNFLSHEEIQKDFSNYLYDFMYNFNKENFEKFTLLLARYRMEKNTNCAKWTIVTFFIAYLDQEKFVFVKPTTTKAIAKALDVDIEYSSYPTFETYEKVYNMIYDFRKESELCKEQNIMLTEAILYCVVKL